jgi:mannitol/fructose-specific phosphotransferase system IIA component (Ntr-type)
LSDPLLRPTTATMDGDSVQAPEGFPLTRLMFFVAPSPRAHLELLAELSRALRNRNVRKLILEGAADADIFAALSPAPDLPNDESGVPAPEQYPAPRGRRS